MANARMNDPVTNSRPERPPRRRRFPLLRHFSLASLACTLIVAVVLGELYRRHAVNELTTQARAEAAAVAQDLSFTLRHEVAELLETAGDAGRAAGIVGRIDQEMRAHSRYLSAAKVKIYTPQGLTLYSTRREEIGKDEEDNEGVRAAMRGEMLSSMVHRDEFNSYDRVVENRDLLQTYLPVLQGEQGRIIGVFELYSDMTDLFARIRNTERIVVASVSGALLVLYGLLFAIVYRADRILRHQERELEDSVEHIHRQNVELDDRVRERTRELEAVNEQLRGVIVEREAAQRHLELARQRAWQQDKLAAIGRLAAGIVHELGNPLAAINGLAQAARDDLEARRLDAVDRSLALVSDHLRRLESITRDVSGFAVPQAREPELVNLNELLTRVLNVLRYDAKLGDIAIESHLDAGLGAVSGIPDQLWQVIMNLVLNAADAIERRPGAPRTITVASRRQAGKAELTVRDQGVGMSEGVIACAFEPFQSTKPPGAGTGLGLALCYAIVRGHAGEIGIESKPGAGTIVSVRLPLADAAA